MALDGKTKIKEEITEKDVYEPPTPCLNTNRRNKAGTASASGETGNTAGNGLNTSGSGGGSGAGGGCISSNLRSCRTPESPESARAVAPCSPMSPLLQQHLSSLAPPPPSRPNRNASTSPVNGTINTSPPPPPPPTQPVIGQTAAAAALVAAAATASHVEQARLLAKLRKFLGSLVQLVQEVHPEISERIRGLVLSLASGGISVDEFCITLKEGINLPLRPYLINLFKSHISLLQRDVLTIARTKNQSTLQYVTSNESSVLDFSSHGSTPEYGDIFAHLESSGSGGALNGAGLNLANNAASYKRRSSDSYMDSHGGVSGGGSNNGVVSGGDWNDYIVGYPMAKRLHIHNPSLSAGPPPPFGANHPPNLFDASNGPTIASAAAANIAENSFNSLIEKTNHREHEIRSMISNETAGHRPPYGRGINMGACNTNTAGGQGATAAAVLASSNTSSTNSTSVGSSTGAMSGEEEWKNIHTMLNCISAMVDKTKRAITILQQRGVEPQQLACGDLTSSGLLELRRHTEEKIAEFKRNAEEAVNQVKRQAVIEIQRAVVAAESRAAEVMAQERLRMEKFLVEVSRHIGTEREMDNKSPLPTLAGTNNGCWNCGRKATETCSGCNLARYCGAFCQHKDWEHHHQICGTGSRTAIPADGNVVKPVSQVISLSSNLRGSITCSPPITLQTNSSHCPTAPTSTQLATSAGNGPQSTGPLVTNGISTK